VWKRCRDRILDPPPSALWYSYFHVISTASPCACYGGGLCVAWSQKVALLVITLGSVSTSQASLGRDYRSIRVAGYARESLESYEIDRIARPICNIRKRHRKVSAHVRSTNDIKDGRTAIVSCVCASCTRLIALFGSRTG
jgi:hypothetical protein